MSRNEGQNDQLLSEDSTTRHLLLARNGRMVTRTYLKNTSHSITSSSSLLSESSVSSFLSRRRRSSSATKEEGEEQEAPSPSPSLQPNASTTPPPSPSGSHKAPHRHTRTAHPKNSARRLREVPDRSPNPASPPHGEDDYQDPHSAATLEALLRGVEQRAIEKGYTLVYFGPTRPSHLPEDGREGVQYLPSLLSHPSLLDACERCCETSIKEATFSPEYPRYCLEEVSKGAHPYLQGVLLLHHPSPHHHNNNNSNKKNEPEVCAFVVSNGMDGYGNIKQTVTHLKAARTRGTLKAPRTQQGRRNPKEITAFREKLFKIQEVSDFVHVTLTATHPQHQRKRLAKLLLCIDLLRWALRGRHRVFLNMAIEKRIDYPPGEEPRVVYAPSLASRSLYDYFDFIDVYPKFEAHTLEETWSPLEADCGRVMANLDLVATAVRVGREIEEGVVSLIGPTEAVAGGRRRPRRTTSPEFSTTHSTKRKKL